MRQRLSSLINQLIVRHEVRQTSDDQGYKDCPIWGMTCAHWIHLLRVP
jgi:hypothetical protein